MCRKRKLKIMVHIIAALLPVVLILLFIYLRDKYEKEPIKLLLLTFFMGAVAVIPILLVENLFMHVKPALLGSGGMTVGALFSYYDAFIVASLTEEVFKFIVLYLFIWNNRNFNEKYDGIVYAVFVSLGFAAIENIGYVFSYGFGVAVLRGLLTVPFHALAGVVMGYYFSLAKFTPEKRRQNLLKALGYAIIVHGLFDFLIMYMEFEGAAKPGLVVFLVISLIIFMIWLWVQGFIKINRMVKASPFKEKTDTKPENNA